MNEGLRIILEPSVTEEAKFDTPDLVLPSRGESREGRRGGEIARSSIDGCLRMRMVITRGLRIGQRRRGLLIKT